MLRNILPSCLDSYIEVDAAFSRDMGKHKACLQIDSVTIEHQFTSGAEGYPASLNASRPASVEDQNDEGFDRESSATMSVRSKSTPDCALHLGVEPESGDKEPFCVPVPRRQYANSQYYHENAESNLIKDERSLLSRWNTATGRSASGCKVCYACDFTVYIPAQSSDAMRMVMPSLLHSGGKYGRTIRFDATVSCSKDQSDSANHITNVPIVAISVALEKESTNPHVWVQSPVARDHGIWYQLKSASPEYSELWDDFIWLARFAHYAIIFLEQGPHSSGFLTTLMDFKREFYVFHASSEKFRTWQTLSQTTDFRQHLVEHWRFIWHAAEACAALQSVVFADLQCISIPAEPRIKQELTTVTPYVKQCFSHIFGNHIRSMSTKSASHNSFSHVQLYEKVKSMPKTKSWRPDNLKVGDVAYLDTNVLSDHSELDSRLLKVCKIRSHPERPCSINTMSDDSESDTADFQFLSTLSTNQADKPPSSLFDQSDCTANLSGTGVKVKRLPSIESDCTPTKASRDYLYITEVILQQSGQYLYRGLWCYQPSTWHAQLDTSYYKHRDTELFLSDHCNCEEHYKDHHFAKFEDIHGVVSVNMFSDQLEGNEFFCRTMYLHAEGNFKHFRREDLSPDSVSLPCGCKTTEMRQRKLDHFAVFLGKYTLGDTVLLNIGSYYNDMDDEGSSRCSSSPSMEPVEEHSLLEPHYIVRIDNHSRRIEFGRLMRRQQLDPASLPHEVLISSEGITLTSKQLGTVVVRRCGVWHIEPQLNQVELPNPLQLNGAGEQFLLRYKLVGSDLISFDSSKIVPIRFQNAALYRQHNKLRGLDVFCGAGNLGAGIRDSGIVQYSSAIDLSSAALHTYRANHTVQEEDSMTFETRYYLGSVNRYLNAEIRAGKDHADEIDIIVAGSPCQGFSAANLSKNSQVSLRNCSLVASFASYVDFYRPKYAVLENVAGIRDNVRLSNGKIINVHMQLLAMALGLGYQVRTFTNHSYMHGSAQSRDRIFVIFAAAGMTLPRQPVQSHENPPSHSIRGKLNDPYGNIFKNTEYDHLPKTFLPRLLRDIWADLPDIGDGSRICIPRPDHRVHAYISYLEKLTCKAMGCHARGVASKVSRSIRKSRGKHDKRRVTRHARYATEVNDLGAIPQALVKHYPSLFGAAASKAFGRSKLHNCM